MPKIVILGSCRFEPYKILAVPKKVKGKWNTEEGYQISTERFYPAIKEADEVWVYAPDGIGEHTQRDLDFAIKEGKIIKFLEIKYSLKEKILEFLGRLFRRHLHYFRYYGLKGERFFSYDHEIYHKRICRCGLVQEACLYLNQEGEVSYWEWE